MNDRKTFPNTPQQSAKTSAGRNAGHIFVVSAPSGAGKTTLCRAVLEHFTEMLYSVSYTTRPPRQGEKDSVDYHFISPDEFKKGINEGKWVEWADVHGHYYGTSDEFLKKSLAAGKDILLVIDIQGTRQILEKYPECVTIFIIPPSLEILRQRLESRGTDSKEVIENRMHNAKKEMTQKDIYRHIIINDRLNRAKKELIALIEKYRRRQ